jgi:hypothetical protein
MPEPDGSGRHCGNHGKRDERMRDAAMMFEFLDRSGKAPQNVEVGGFGRQSGGQRSIGSLAIEAGASDARAGEKVRNGLHTLLEDIVAEWRQRMGLEANPPRVLTSSRLL